MHVANSVLAATVEVTQDDMPRQTARALGVRVNCIVEVALLMTPESGSTDPDTSAIDVAHLMMDKVSELS